VKRLLALGLSLFLAACASLPAPVVSLAGIPSRFEMSGRLSVRQGSTGEIARLRWERSPQTDLWVLTSPFGTELARIERGTAGLLVQRPGEVPLEAASFSELTEYLLGAAIDERLLVAWLHRRPVPGPEGWQVEIDESQTLGGQTIARRLTATQGDTVVKLVVDDYRAQPE
jgi:outer membrane lipoprotein LolB